MKELLKSEKWFIDTKPEILTLLQLNIDYETIEILFNAIDNYGLFIEIEALKELRTDIQILLNKKEAEK